MTDFTLINRLEASILSYKSTLAKAESVDDIDKICKNISDVETEILNERKKELNTLLKKKDDILQKMATLETSLDTINREINARVARYRDSATSRLSRIESEINAKKNLPKNELSPRNPNDPGEELSQPQME